MTRNHVEAVQPKTLLDVYTAVAWYLSRCVAVETQREMLDLYCDEVQIPRPWSGRLPAGVTAETIVGKRICVSFLEHDGTDDARTYEEIGTVLAVRPFEGVYTLFADGPILVNDDDEDWRVADA